MITTFEDYTFEVTDQEKKTILPRVHAILLKAIGKERATTNEQVLKEINEAPELQAARIKTSTPRIRKIIHELRVSGKIPLLIASSEGYYITSNQEEVDKYLDSLRERINSISEIYQAIKGQSYALKQIATRNMPQPEQTPSLF